MITDNQTASTDSQIMLASLTKAVNEALDKKKRLGQYAVIWTDNQPRLVGEDVPKTHSQK
ncbi:MAG: hypothetical protein ACU88J_04205 [Gammaproteobacteria bacterium]